MENCPQLVGSTKQATGCTWPWFTDLCSQGAVCPRATCTVPVVPQAPQTQLPTGWTILLFPEPTPLPASPQRRPPTQTLLSQQYLNHNLGPTHHPLPCGLPPPPALITPEPGPRELGTVPVPQSLLKLFKFANPYSSLLICLTRSFPWKPQ